MSTWNHLKNKNQETIKIITCFIFTFTKTHISLWYYTTHVPLWHHINGSILQHILSSSLPHTNVIVASHPQFCSRTLLFLRFFHFDIVAFFHFDIVAALHLPLLSSLTHQYCIHYKVEQYFHLVFCCVASLFVYFLIPLLLVYVLLYMVSIITQRENFDCFLILTLFPF